MNYGETCLFILRFILKSVLCVILNICSGEIILTVTGLIFAPFGALLVFLVESMIMGIIIMLRDYTWK
jgi:hypothetical protein